MAFVKNSSQQLSFEDSTLNLTERSRKYLKNSWAEAFSQLIFPRINEERFAVLYSDNPASRPNTPVNVIVGMLILKEFNNHTDDDLLETMLFDIRYQYALHTSSFADQPISDRTLSRFRARLYDYEQQTGIDLMKEEMESLADAFVQMMGLSGQTKRMDSLMVASSCKRMRRLELFYSCVSRMVKAIRATGETELLDKRLCKYLEVNDENDTLYRTPASEVDRKLAAAMADAVRLLELMGQPFEGMAEYQQLKRLVEEQTEVTGQGRKLRDKTKISPSSLQNPSDEDATFRTKAGGAHKGYVGNLVETFDDTGAVITRMDYKPNTHSDMSFGLSVIADEESEATQAVTLIADGAYGNDELLMGPTGDNKVRLVATNLTGKAPDPIMSEFVIDEQRKILVRCPAGHAPTDSHYRTSTDSYFAHFNKGTCSKCPLRQHCGVKFQKKTGLVHIALKTIHRAQYLIKLGQDEFKKLTRQRNALEGVPSVLRRKYDVDHMPVRGYVRSKLWFFLKVGAVNARRMVVWAAKQPDSLLFQVLCVRHDFLCWKIRQKSKLLVSDAV